MFDQFEEVFSRGGSPEHVKAVLDSIADLVADRLPPALAQDREAARRLNLQSQQYHVVLSFRSDFLADVESWEKRAFLPRRESLHLSRCRARTPSRRSTVPAPRSSRRGWACRSSTSSSEQEDRQSRARVTEVEPVLLSLCCDQLNLRRQPGAKIDAALLNTVGKGILKGFYDEALAGRGPTRQQVHRRQPHSGRPVPQQLPARGRAGERRSHRGRSLTRLEQRRLLRIDPQGGEPRIELIHDRLVSVVREARDARRAEERRLREREESEKKVKDALAADQLATSERERARLVRWRAALGLAVLLMAAALVAAGYFSQRAKSEGQNVIAERKALEETAVLLNSDLAAAKESLARTEAELANVQRSLAELQVQHAAEAGGTVNRATVDSAKARLESAKAKQEEIQQKTVQTREAKSEGRVEVNGWRLSSGGCSKGAASVSGTARFSVEPRGNDVVLSEEFQGSGSGYAVDSVEFRHVAQDVAVRAAEPAILRSQDPWSSGSARGKWNSRPGASIGSTSMRPDHRRARA